MKNFKKYCSAFIIIAFIVGNLIIDFSIDSSNFNLFELYNQSQAQYEDPTYPNGMDGYCRSGCIYYWPDDGSDIVYGVEIICNGSVPGRHCIFTGCTMGYC